MENGSAETSSTVNEIVEKHIAQSSSSEANSGNSQQGNNTDDNTGNSGGGDSGAAGDGSAANANDAPAPDQIKDLLKELGVASLDDLKAKLKDDSSKELTPEEKAKLAEVYEADLINFAVKSGDMKLEEFATVKELKKSSDQDLVYSAWKKEFKEENPEIEEADFEAAAKEAFETEFKLNSENEKTKARGENRIKKEAADMRKPFESKYEGAKSKFDQQSELRKAYPAFDKKMDEYASANIPEKFEIFKDKDGDDDVLIAPDVTAEERKEISDKVKKQLKTDYVYDLYKAGKIKEIEEIAKKLTQDLLWDKKREVGLKELAKTYMVRGSAKKEIGATNSFALNQSGAAKSKTNGAAQNAEQEVLDSLSGTKK